jgi:hypothetical protein
MADFTDVVLCGFSSSEKQTHPVLEGSEVGINMG